MRVTSWACIGNSGGSSEPHLHRWDQPARRRWLSSVFTDDFSKIKNGASKTVSGVPVDGEFYS